MTTSHVRRTLGAALTGSLLLTASPASAETVRVADGRGDAWEERYDAEQDEMTYAPAGSPVNADVRGVAVRHNGHGVGVRTRFVDLRNNAEGVVVAVRLRTSEGLRRWAMVVKDGGRRGEATLMTRRARGVHCPGLTFDLDFAEDLASVRVPRACLSRPRWVQVVVAAGNNANDGRRSFVDVAGRPGHRFAGWSERVRSL